MKNHRGLDVERRRRGFVVLSVLLFALFPLVELATAAQVGTTPASIVGQLKDESGGVLPGVTVTATSPALQVRQVTAVTDERGEYRLALLPIGTYAVEYTLSGFQTIRQENVQLAPGFVAKLDHVMKVGSIEQMVTVSAASPIVDVATTVVRTELTQAAAQLLPSARAGLTSYLNLVPGTRTRLDVGGLRFSSGVTFSAYGQSGEVWVMLEGVVTARGSNIGQHFDFDAVDATRIEAAGHSAEGPTRGLLIDTILKSGGNQFHATIGFDGTSGRFQADNIDAALRKAGVLGAAKLHPMIDLSGTAGGKIVQDKLWFYGAGRYRSKSEDLLGAFYPDGRQATYDIWQSFAIGKLSYQATPNHKLIGFYHDSSKAEVRDASALMSTDSMVRVPAKYLTSKGEWQAVPTNSLTLSALVGHWSSRSFNNAVAATPKVSTYDQATQQVGGDAVGDGNQSDDGREQARANLGWYRPDLFLGHHEFKAGFDADYENAKPIRGNRRTHNYRLVFDNGVPFAIDTYNYPVKPVNRVFYTGLYVQDNWTAARRLTLNVGIRYGREHGHLPQQCRDAGELADARCYAKIQLPIWNSWAPRVQAAFDLFGDGSTVVKGGYGRFVNVLVVSTDVGAYNPLVQTTTTFRWHDLNGNKAYDPGEVNLALDGPDIISTAAGVPGVPNPNLKPMTDDQFTIALERQLMPNLGVRIGYVYDLGRNTFRTLTPLRPYSAYSIPITSPDPGPDGVVGTGDDPGRSLTYYDYPAAYRGAAFDQITRINDPNADRTYKTIEVGVTKRISGRWQANESYAATLRNVTVPISSAFNPNAEIDTADNTWERTGKAAASYEFPHDIVVSGNFDYRSGDPQARQVLLRGGKQIATFVVNAEPIGSLRLPSTKLFDVQVRKRFSLGQGRILDFRVMLSNVLNSNTVVSRVVRSGKTYLMPTVATGAGAESPVLAPRLVQFGVHLEW